MKYCHPTLLLLGFLVPDSTFGFKHSLHLPSVCVILIIIRVWELSNLDIIITTVCKGWFYLQPKTCSAYHLESAMPVCSNLSLLASLNWNIFVSFSILTAPLHLTLAKEMPQTPWYPAMPVTAVAKKAMMKGGRILILSLIFIKY